MRLGYELGYAENLIKPSDLRNPDHCPSKTMTDKERLYIRIFGLPDTIKQQQARAVFSILNNLSFSSVLDIGCAQGHYSIRIARKYSHSQVKGIDFNEEKLSIAKFVKKKFNLKNLKLEKMNICDRSTTEKYDLVLLLQVIEHIQDDRATLKKIREIMSNNGHLVITAPNEHLSMINWYKRYVTVEGHFRDGYKPGELAKMLADANFKIKEVRHLSATIGQLIEKIETYLKINFPSFFFALLYPFLECIAFLDDYLKAKNDTNTSGILVVAVAV
jgi:2-polyprenyl-3-methyl-5-hydroxy-6-metoxy-1,4-benzoquinol methylase